MKYPLSLHAFPKAILHVDADAFFASVEQSRDPKLKGIPVITGKERGIVASMSYEAKNRGVKRGMRLFEVKKLCPDAVFLPSDYETYSLLSVRFYNIVRRYTPDIEEFSIDECFADITGMRRPFRMSYEKIAEKLKHDLDIELGFTFSMGLGPNKIISKLASKWKKPSGLTIIPGYQMHLYLNKLTVDKVCGIGPQTTAYLNKHGIKTALDFAKRSLEWVKQHLTKPGQEIWEELNGRFVIPLELGQKTHYQSISKFKTFSPPSREREFVFSQLSKNIENACIKCRRYHFAAQDAVFILRTHDFTDTAVEFRFARPSNIPNEMTDVIRDNFDKLFEQGRLYRGTGIVLARLKEDNQTQYELFDSVFKVEGYRRIYNAVDKLSKRYGKHTVYLGSSFLANTFAQHLGDRGDVPKRKLDLFPGETKRKRLGIPSLGIEVV